MLAAIGFSSSSPGAAVKKDEGASVDAGPAKAVVREGSGGANLTSRKGPMGDLPMGAEREDAAERMRRIERRAAAAQQRSLDKKISSLTEEMAEVEAMLNKSLENRQVEPSTAERRKADMQVEMAIDLASSANKVANGEVHAAQAARVYTPSRSAEGASPTSNRKVRIMKARTMGEDDSNEKYGARDRSGSILRMLAIYFGVETSSSRLPLPLSIQRAGKRPLNVENTVVLILVISVVIGGIIFYLSSSKKLPVQHGVAAGARGWG